MNPRLAWLSAFLMAAGLALPIGYYEEDLVYWSQFPLSAMFVAFGIAAAVAGERWLGQLAKGELWAWLGPVAVLIAGVGPFMLPTAELAMRTSSDGFVSAVIDGLSTSPGFWLTIAGILLFAWTVMQHMSAQPPSRLYALLVPALFGIALIYLWQAVVVGFAVPRVLLPAPTEIRWPARSICASRMKSSRCWNSASVSPGKPAMKVLLITISGQASRH